MEHMTEYWLQKKTIGGWSMVTWYSDLDQAKLNYDRLKQGAGYSYRLVQVEAIQEDMLDEVVTVEAPEIEQTAKANVWGGQIKKPDTSSGFSGWGDMLSNSSKLEHGLSGSVWVINHSTKDKKRVPAGELDAMIAQGYVRGGPRTQFRE